MKDIAIENITTRECLPTLSVIIIAQNSAHTIGKCLRSIINNNYPINKFEIIVVDNDSTDDTSIIANHFPVKTIFEPRRGRAIARNTGIKHASGSIILFIDSDCIAAPDWLLSHISLLMDNNIDVLGGSILPASKDNSILLTAEHFTYFGQFYPLNKPRDTWNVVTCNVSIKRTAFKRMGLFDERLVAGVETPLFWNAFRRGIKIRFNPRPMVYHHYTQLDLPSILQKKKTTGYWYYNAQLPQRLPMSKKIILLLLPSIFIARLARYIFQILCYVPQKIKFFRCIPYLIAFSLYWTLGYILASKKYEHIEIN